MNLQATLDICPPPPAVISPLWIIIYTCLLYRKSSTYICVSAGFPFQADN